MNLIDKIEYIINYDSRTNYDPDYLDKYKMYKFQILKRLEQAFEEDPENPDFNDFCSMECYLDDVKGNHNNYVFDFSKGMQETLGEGYHLCVSDWMGWDGIVKEMKIILIFLNMFLEAIGRNKLIFIEFNLILKKCKER